MKEQVDPIRTFEARTPLDDLGLCILKDMAEIYSEVIHTLFAHIQRGKNPKDLKSDFLKKYGITGRQFNAIRNQLDGKIASIEARIPLLIEDKKEKIQRDKKLKKRIDDIKHLDEFIKYFHIFYDYTVDKKQKYGQKNTY